MASIKDVAQKAGVGVGLILHKVTDKYNDK